VSVVKLKNCVLMITDLWNWVMQLYSFTCQWICYS